MIPVVDHTRLRNLVVDANDGIVATAGIVEGLIGAGAGIRATVIAALSSMLAGGIALGGARSAETALELDARSALLEEERRQLALSPEEARAELAAIYQEKGLSDDLASRVAAELSEHNALAAHAEAEHGIRLEAAPIRPVLEAAASGGAFAAGSIVVLLTVLLTPVRSLGGSTFVAVAVSLTLTSLVVARWGNLPVARTIVRTVGIGMTAMAVSFALGSLLDL